jgi:hypothetical protein
VPNRPRGFTIPELLFREPPDELVALAKAWSVDAATLILDVVWRAYDTMAADPRLRDAILAATDNLERNITEQLEAAIQELLTGNEPFSVQHEATEGESRPPRGRPPQYDIAFKMKGNVRVMWPLEAKVMPPDQPMSGYIETVKDRFLTCVYAPFTGEGAMVGYVLRADIEDLFRQISETLGSKFEVFASIRAHRISAHERNVPEGRAYPKAFRCHHLLMDFTAVAPPLTEHETPGSTSHKEQQAPPGWLFSPEQ